MSAEGTDLAIANMNLRVENNQSFRKVILTTKLTQLVLMNLHDGESLGMEIHPDNDQLFYFVLGTGFMFLGDALPVPIGPKSFVCVPAGTRHNLTHDSKTSQRLAFYTIYSPPHHAPGLEHKTKADGDAYEKKNSAYSSSQDLSAF
jgi:mannose-6-phosphate isomerase-like protein (cupin superfamily)